MDVYYSCEELVTMGASFKTVIISVTCKILYFKIFRNLTRKTLNSIINYNET